MLDVYTLRLEILSVNVSSQLYSQDGTQFHHNTDILLLQWLSRGLNG